MLKALVSDINTVDEGHRQFYVAKGDKFVLNVTPAEGYELDDVKGLKSALGNERFARQSIETQLKAFEGLDAGTARAALTKVTEFGDLDPKAAKTALETAERLTKLDPEKEAEKIADQKFQNAKAQLQSQWGARETSLTTQIATLQDTLAKRDAQVKEHVKMSEIKTQLVKANPLDDAMDLLEIMADKAVKLNEINGQMILQVVDANGTPRIKDHLMTPFTVGDLFAEYRATKPALFKPDASKTGVGISASNPGQTNSTAGQANPWAKETRNFTQQALLQKSNPTLAARFKAEAGVA